MDRLVRMMRLVLVLMFATVMSLEAASVSAGAQGTASTSDSYVSELSGWEIEIGDGYEIADAYTEEYPEGVGELIFIESDSGFYQIAFFDDPDDPATTLELYNEGFASEMDEFEILETDETRDGAWSLALATVGEQEVLYYAQVTGDVEGNVDLMEALFAPTDLFFEAFEAGQEDILIEGDGIFADVDVADLEEIAGDGSTSRSRTTTTETGTETETATETEAATETETETETSGQRGTVAGEVFVSEVTGVEIEFSEPFRLGNSDVYGAGAEQEESVTIRGPASNVTIGFFVGPDAQTSLDEFLGGFDSSAQERTTIDSGYEDGVAWTFDQAVLGDGTEAVMYLQVSEDVLTDHLVMTGVIADARFFVEEFEDAQALITVDGEPMFAGIDVTDLEDMLDQGASVTTSTDTETETETEGSLVAEKDEDETSEAASRRERARLPGTETSTDTETNGNETETGTGGRAEIPAELEGAGLNSTTEYVSPQHDTEIVWGDFWFADLEDPETAVSDTASGMDSLSLIWNGEDFAMIFVDISPADGLLPEDFVDYWLSDEYLAENADADAEILLDDVANDAGAVVMVDYLSDGEEVIIAKEAILLDGGETIAVVTLIGFPEPFGDTYADAEDDIQIDDMSAFNVFSPREVERALP